jgi:ubiquinone/menaquinone biosynthesis C-methylase UbiE
MDLDDMSLSKLEYDKSAYFYDEIMNSFKMDFSFYRDLTEILKPRSILELGCGMGRLFPMFMPEAKEITGLDLSDSMLSQGRQYYTEQHNEHTQIEFIRADMCSYEIDKKYDLIVFALSVLKHLDTDEKRLKALRNAKKHLHSDGFIVFDQTPFLYASVSTDWIDAKNSLVANWVPDSDVLSGYQWKKTVRGDTDILHWRYHDAGKTPFVTQFTTYRYDIEALIKHLTQLDMRYELLLTEWGVNGLRTHGKRFVGVASHPAQTHSLKQQVVEKVLQRNELLWSDHHLYLADKKAGQSF